MVEVTAKYKNAVYKILKNKEDVEDTIQDSWVAWCTHKHTVKSTDPISIQAFFNSILMNKARDLSDRNRTILKYIDPEADILLYPTWDTQEANVELQDILTFADTLPYKQRLVFLEVLNNGNDYGSKINITAAAESLNMKYMTAKSHWRFAILKYKEYQNEKFFKKS